MIQYAQRCTANQSTHARKSNRAKIHTHPRARTRTLTRTRIHIHVKYYWANNINVRASLAEAANATDVNIIAILSRFMLERDFLSFLTIAIQTRTYGQTDPGPTDQPTNQRAGRPHVES